MSSFFIRILDVHFDNILGEKEWSKRELGIIHMAMLIRSIRETAARFPGVNDKWYFNPKTPHSLSEEWLQGAISALEVAHRVSFQRTDKHKGDEYEISNGELDLLEEKVLSKLNSIDIKVRRDQL